MASLKWYQAAFNATNVNNSTRGAIFDPEVRREQEREMKNRDKIAAYENVLIAQEEHRFKVLTNIAEPLCAEAREELAKCPTMDSISPEMLRKFDGAEAGAEYGRYCFGTLNNYLKDVWQEDPLTDRERLELGSFMELHNIYPDPDSMEACLAALRFEGCFRGKTPARPRLISKLKDDLDDFREPNPYVPNSIEHQRFHERDGMLARQRRDAKQALDGARAERMTMLEKSPVWQEAMASIYKSAGRDEIVSDDAQLGLWRFYERNAMKFGEVPTVRSIRAAAISYWGSDAVKLLPSELGEREFAALSPEDMKKYMAAQSSSLTLGIMGNLHPVQYGG